MDSKGNPEPRSWKNDWRVVYYAMLYSCFFAMVSLLSSLDSFPPFLLSPTSPPILIF